MIRYIVVREVLLICCSKVMVSLIGPYSCLLFKMCREHADWGSLCLNESDLFPISLF